MTSVLGIHHVTAIASDPQRNLDFYVGLLGLRLVKRTVNFDDPQTYHFYFGDGVGTPGSILTFFPWPGARRGSSGVGQVNAIAFAAAPAALDFWAERLRQHGVDATRRTRDGGEELVRFQDYDGLALEIVAHPAADTRPSWGDAPGIPAEHALHGFHSVTLWVHDGRETEQVLVDTLGFRRERADGALHRFSVGDGGPGTLVDLRSVGAGHHGTGGAGTVHHVAWRVTSDAAELEVREQVLRDGLSPTPVIDRQYFHSVYFREPGGALFELATDPPGFAIDESVEHLGERLMLPPQYEPARAQLEAILPKIHLPMSPAEAEFIGDATGPENVSGDALGFVHRYVPPSENAERAGSTTLLLLHGTGGNEEDLVPLGRAVLPGAAILSPRGNVMERGMPRFFRRHAEGVFDQEDLARRTTELADFVEAAATTYGFERDGIVALGFSNGANIAASLLLRRPGLLRAAVLLSPMVPFEPDLMPDLTGTSIFIGAGRADPIVPVAQVERLAELFRSAGADVTVHWETGGHTIARSEVSAAQRWIAHCLLSPARPSGATATAQTGSTHA